MFRLMCNNYLGLINIMINQYIMVNTLKALDKEQVNNISKMEIIMMVNDFKIKCREMAECSIIQVSSMKEYE